METLEELRRRLDAADDAIVAALKVRFALTAKVRELKSREQLPRVDAKREREILSRVAAMVEPGDRDTVCAVYEALLTGSRGGIETVVRGVCVRSGRLLVCRGQGAASVYLPGGHVDFGETAREALKRELLEEAALAVEVGEFLGVVENSFVQHGRRHAEVNLVYAMEVPTDAVRSQESWIGFEWCELDRLGEIGLLPEAMAALVRKCGG